MKRRRDPIEEKRESAIYGLLFFFIVSFVVKLVFGALSGSKSLMVSGIFALFGVFVVTIGLLRMAGSRKRFIKSSVSDFNPEKLEFFIASGASMIIAVTTGALLYSLLHLAFYHTAYPPGFSAAWVSALIAAVNLYMIHWMREGVDAIEGADVRRIKFLLNKDFLLSVFVMLTVIIARCGFYVVDYVLAALEALFIIGYSVYFLSNSLKGLMDASIDNVMVKEISGHIKKADPGLRIKELRVNPAGMKIEIIAIIGMSKGASLPHVQKAVKKIKMVLNMKLNTPHEVFVGVRT